MPQHDLTIANQNAPAFRSDLNSALEAIASLNAGTSAPATSYANQLWHNETDGIIRQRNSGNTGDTQPKLLHNNASSGLTATNQEDAIIELASAVDTLESSAASSTESVRVYQTITTGDSSQSGNNDDTAITGLSITLTPASSSSKFLIFLKGEIEVSGGGQSGSFGSSATTVSADFGIKRGNVIIDESNFYKQESGHVNIYVINYLNKIKYDQPSTSNAITYQAYYDSQSMISDTNIQTKKGASLTIIEIL